MKRTFLMFSLAAILLGGGGAAYAHHSFTATYDNTKRVEVEGVIREFIWRNPHSFVRIDVTNKEGKVESWGLEWGSTNELAAAKYPVTRTTLKAGDTIIVGGEPRRDPAIKGMRLSSIKRPADGWTWEGTVD
jgi:hypothetical protein